MKISIWPAWCLLGQAPHAHCERIGLTVYVHMWFISQQFYTGLQVRIILQGTPSSVTDLGLYNISFSCRIGLQYMQNCMYTYRSRLSPHLLCFHNSPSSNRSPRLTPDNGVCAQTHAQPTNNWFLGRQGEPTFRYILVPFSVCFPQYLGQYVCWQKHLPAK